MDPKMFFNILIVIAKTVIEKNSKKFIRYCGVLNCGRYLFPFESKFEKTVTISRIVQYKMQVDLYGFWKQRHIQPHLVLRQQTKDKYFYLSIHSFCVYIS